MHTVRPAAEPGRPEYGRELPLLQAEPPGPEDEDPRERGRQQQCLRVADEEHQGEATRDERRARTGPVPQQQDTPEDDRRAQRQGEAVTQGVHGDGAGGQGEVQGLPGQTGTPGSARRAEGEQDADASRECDDEPRQPEAPGGAEGGHEGNQEQRIAGPGLEDGHEPLVGERRGHP